MRWAHGALAACLAASGAPGRVDAEEPARPDRPAAVEPLDSLPPLLLPWPLRPLARRPPGAPRSVAIAPETPPPERPPAVAPAPGGPSRGEPSVAPPSTGVAAPRPAEGAVPAGPNPPSPPGSPAAREPAAAVGGPVTPKAPSRRRTETELEFKLPELPPPRVAVGLGDAELRPPAPDLRRWAYRPEEGLAYDALETRKEGDWVILTGAVDIRIESDRIQADVVRISEKEQVLLAEGNVVLDHLDSRLAGSRMEYDLETNTGTVWDAIGYAGSDLSFTGKRAEKIAENKYAVYDGSFTSCTQPLPIWHVKASKAIIHIDHFVYTWNPRIAFKKVPAFYLPWVAIPIKQERATGFMIPKISSSSTRGFSVEEDFFWAINRSTDLLVGGRFWDKYGWRVNLQSRWYLNGMPGPGFVKAAFLQAKDDADQRVGDELVEPERWHLRFEHKQKIWDAWDVTVRGEVGSDQLVDRDEVLTDLNDPQPIFNQRVTLQRRWGKHSLNVDLENDERERESSSDSGLSAEDAGSAATTTTTTTSRLPEVEYRVSGVQIGGRRWAALSVQGSVAGLRRMVNEDVTASYGGVRLGTDVDTTDHDYLRADLFPQLSFPVATSFLEIVPSLNLRGTWWSRVETGETSSVDVDVGDPPLDTATFRVTPGVDDDVFLWSWDAGLRLGGPDFQRIYRRAAAPGKRKWQHLIEPEIDFTYTPRVHPDAFLINGDQRRGHYTGRFEGTGTTGGVSLVNTFRSKTVVPVGMQEPQARDVLIWRLSADYDFKDKTERNLGMSGAARSEGSHWSDISSDVNFRPTDNISFTLRNRYDILQDDVVQTSLVGGVEGNWGYADLSFSSRRDNRTLEDSSTELSLTGENWLYRSGRLRIGYDLTKSFNGSQRDRSGRRLHGSWPYKRLVVSYYNQCCGLSLSWRDNDDRSVDREKEWTFIVSLKDLGNFLRYRRRSTEE